ncbi:Hypothetical protein BIBO2_1793 [Brucella sp. BO2]|nr:Hypothetical protein BIBO1_0345 [Brucella inopinata BO1]EFM59271.1 Hypothetical protein BIBO2_1793 [Brucella sp. BO2]
MKDILGEHAKFYMISLFLGINYLLANMTESTRAFPH